MASLLREPRALPRDPALTREARAHIAGNGRLSPVEQLEIYREQFWLRHTASLLEDFPGLSGVLGQTDWEKLVESYLGETTPTAWSLRELGAELPTHVERAAWLPHRELCVDMAELEWAMVELFDAPDVPPMDPARLTAISPEAWETARLVLSPALTLQSARYPVADLRRALERASSATVPVPLPAAADSHLVLYRGRDQCLHHASVTRSAFELLQALQDELPLIRACERAAERAPLEADELAENVGRWFSDWGGLGWIVDVETE